jgi:hypothetical protein
VHRVPRSAHRERSQQSQKRDELAHGPIVRGAQTHRVCTDWTRIEEHSTRRGCSRIHSSAEMRVNAQVRRRPLNATRAFAEGRRTEEHSTRRGCSRIHSSAEMRVNAQVRGSPLNETRALAAGGGS